MKSSFQRNLLVGFGVSLLLLIVSSVASFMSIRNLLNSLDQVQRTSEIIQNFDRVLSILKDAETGQRGYLVTGRETFLAPYNGAYELASKELEATKQLVKEDPVQTSNCNQLNEVIEKRLRQLEKLIISKRDSNTINIDELEMGKYYMDEARKLVKRMTDHEKSQLALRTEKMNRLANTTPLLIVLAAVLSMVITIVFFLRINNDFKKRTELQQELQEKDEDITRRIGIIRNIAEKISEGDYATRVPEGGKDGLGVLSVSLNKMASSLDYSFNLLSDKEWMQTGIAELNTKMIGEVDMQSLTAKVIEFVAGYTDSIVGAIYLKENEDELHFSNGYAFMVNANNGTIRMGEGITGQAASIAKHILLTDIDEAGIIVSYAAGSIKPKSIIAVPLQYEKNVTGVIELASLKNYTANDIAFLEAVSQAIGTSINSVQTRKKLQEFLEETQAQSEELQAQHAEMENINTELEAQAHKLQASEEELRVQQEELSQSNAELEEKARLLEEKNQLIVERNLEIQSKAEQLALSTKYKSEFLANMSHELRTPLNSILLLSRLMSENTEKNLSDQQIEYAKVIQGSGNGLLALINEILDLSKIESGKMELQVEEVFVHDIIGEMKALFEPIAQEKRLPFNIQLEKDVPASLKTDRMRLEQVVKNLLSNALKFTSQGQVDFAIAMQDAAHVCFTVKDTGIGVSAEKQQLIFEAFQQEDGSTRRKYGGTGLGLSISRELAKLLGGKITLKSAAGEGSAFTLVVPIDASALVAEQVPELIEAVAEPSIQKEKKNELVVDTIPLDIPDDRASIKTNDKVLLIVEDDTAFAKSLIEYTRKQGYKAVSCVRGDEALPLAKKYKPTGILLDIQLPVKDGLEVMDELKTDPATKHIPVHMMSSHEMKNKSLSKGAIDFISKPVAFEKMQDVFEKLEYVLQHNPKKVLIVEENAKHAKALAYFLETYDVNAEIKNSIDDGIIALREKEVNCVILDMGVPAQNSYYTLEKVKKTPGLENLPIIIFTGKSLSKGEEQRIKQYADTIVVKTAYSYQRIIDEVSLFLHLVEENNKPAGTMQYKKLGMLNDVLRNKNVLVADDDVRNIYSLTRSLENYSMNIIAAMDGKEALQKLKDGTKVDVILMDMMMPEMDGYTAIQEIKKHLAFKKIPIIAVTAKAMVGDREKCIKAGASDYITKPVDIDQLLSLLRVWLYDSNV